MSHRTFLASAALCATLLLAGCGGGNGGDGGDATKTDTAPARGSLVSAQQTSAMSSTQIDASSAALGIQPLTGMARCSVTVSAIDYVTRDPRGKPVTATAGVFVPGGSASGCTGSRPVLLYAHGTTSTRSYDMASVASNGEAALVVAFHAAQGFIVVAPNYMGYSRSPLSYTPYLNAESSAIDMVDALRAAQAHLATASPTLPSDKLFIAGYSQGGHVAMATQRAIERDYASEFSLVGSGPMSGPYNLVQFGDTIVSGTVNAGATLFVPLIINSYQQSWGNIYSSPSEVYQSPFDQSAENLLPTDTPLSTLIAQGKLPADYTFTRLFGSGGLLTDSFRSGYASSAFRQALQANTLLDWTPTHPISLCGGANDPTVFYANTSSTRTALAAKGGAAVTAYNLEDASSVGSTIYGGFQQAKAAAGANAAAQYHAALVPPFCHALVRDAFQQLLATAP